METEIEAGRVQALARILETIHGKVKAGRVDGQNAWLFQTDDGLLITAGDRELRLHAERNDLLSLAIARLSDALRRAAKPPLKEMAAVLLARGYLEGADVSDIAITFDRRAAHVTVRMTLPRTLERLSMIEALAGSLLPQQDALLLAAGASHVRALLAPDTPSDS